MKQQPEDLFIKIAHRGASAYEPENTLKSFERAIELKADMIEFDVRYSLDRQLVVMHDPTLDRTTNGTGQVSRKTLAELKELDAGQGERIPTFEEVIQCGLGKTKFVIELKDDWVENDVIQILKKYDLTDEVFVVSFKAKRLKMIKVLESRIRTGLILVASFNPIGRARDCGADAVAPHRRFIYRRFVERARESGLYTFTWTVDETSKARELKDMGITGIVTNKPDIL